MSVGDLQWLGGIPRFDGRALCAETDPELFFPEVGENTTSVKARQVCNRCEVKAECLAWALKNPVAGVWGGTTERERRNMTRYERRELPIRHGTTGGYRTHLRRREHPCDPCQQAEHVRQADYRDRRKGVA